MNFRSVTAPTVSYFFPLTVLFPTVQLLLPNALLLSSCCCPHWALGGLLSWSLLVIGHVICRVDLRSNQTAGYLVITAVRITVGHSGCFAACSRPPTAPWPPWTHRPICCVWLSYLGVLFKSTGFAQSHENNKCSYFYTGDWAAGFFGFRCKRTSKESGTESRGKEE